MGTINTVKFFYNGIKINGEKTLIKFKVGCVENHDGTGYLYFNADYRWDNDLINAMKEIVEYKYTAPRYWGDDGQQWFYIPMESPLYCCFRYMFISAKLHDCKIQNKELENKELEKELAELPHNAPESVIQWAKEYIQTIDAIRQEEENKKKAKEEAEQKAQFDAERAERFFITDCANRYPIGNADTYVEICWSEHPAFYDWDDNELRLSVKAAEEVFKKLDVKCPDGGYYKTKFQIVRGNEIVYIGRYDLGDEENGLINHLKVFAEYCYNTDHDEDAFIERQELINNLIDLCNNQKEYEIVLVEVAKDLDKIVENYKKSKEE